MLYCYLDFYLLEAHLNKTILVEGMLKGYIENSLLNAMDVLVKENFLERSSFELAKNSLIAKTKNPQFGDFSINTAMLIAKSEGKSPLQIAQALADKLKADENFSNVSVANPGFVNLSLSDLLLSKAIAGINLQKKDYGKSTLPNKSKILVEFVSANPTGPLHLGHAWGAFIGDAVCRLLKAAGFDVVKEYYVNDTGNQIDTLARTIYKRYQELFGRTITIEKGEYPGGYVIDIAKKLKERDGDIWLDKPEKDWILPLSEFGVECNLTQIKKVLNEINIDYDSWYFESKLHKNNSLDVLIEEYEKKGMLYDAEEPLLDKEKVRRKESKASSFSHMQEGGTFLKTTLFGDEEDRIVKRKDGRYVYFTADLAYHHEKFLRGFDKIINIFGADHAGHVIRMKAAMQALGHDIAKMNFILTQMVKVVRDGKEVKFSKRAGQVYGIDDLVEDIGPDAARFVFLMKSPSSQFELDLDNLTQQNNDNPVFYVQYGHARMATILNKAKQEHGLEIQNNFGAHEQKLLVLPEEREMILAISEFEDTVTRAALSLEPHKIIYFAHGLVKLFHSYFTKYRNDEKIISENKSLTLARLSLVSAVKQTLQNSLLFLGISAPEHMKQSDFN